MNRRAIKHARDVRASNFWFWEDVRTIRSMENDPLNEDRIWQIGEALATADAAHWRRCLASAKRTGARADYYRANLNKWHDGFSGQIGNLSEPLLY